MNGLGTVNSRKIGTHVRGVLFFLVCVVVVSLATLQFDYDITIGPFRLVSNPEVSGRNHELFSTFETSSRSVTGIKFSALGRRATFLFNY
jgi:hypothetical protein